MSSLFHQQQLQTRQNDKTEIEHKSHMPRDQPNSRFHGRDIFREIGLLPLKTAHFRVSMKSVIFREF